SRSAPRRTRKPRGCRRRISSAASRESGAWCTITPRRRRRGKPRPTNRSTDSLLFGRATPMRVVFRILAVLVLVAALAVAWLALRSPDMRPASTGKIEATPERLARGEYLVTHVADCLPCHSEVHGDRFAIPVKAGTEGQGGYAFDKKLGVPGL